MTFFLRKPIQRVTRCNNLGEPLGEAEPTLPLGKQHEATIRRDPSSIKGGSDLLALNGWKGERMA
jgi:hypothetical protein